MARFHLLSSFHVFIVIAFLECTSAWFLPSKCGPATRHPTWNGKLPRVCLNTPNSVLDSSSLHQPHRQQLVALKVTKNPSGADHHKLDAASHSVGSSDVNKANFGWAEAFQDPLDFFFDGQEIDKKDLMIKTINFLFLAVTFGWAIYTILNIDSGMTRGWTKNEVAMRIPLDNWSSYEAALEESPVVTKTMINVIIYLLGDWLSQTVFQQKNVLDFDVTRILKNGLIGLFFGPLVHQYYQFSDQILPVDGGMTIRLGKIFMDQTIYLTVKCSMYIFAVSMLAGDSIENSKQIVKDKIPGVVFTAWKFWPLVHCITYGVIPARHRILWVNSVDLVWNAILATQAQKGDDHEESDVPPMETPALELAALEPINEASGVSPVETPALELEALEPINNEASGVPPMETSALELEALEPINNEALLQTEVSDLVDPDLTIHVQEPLHDDHVAVVGITDDVDENSAIATGGVKTSNSTVTFQAG